MELSKIRNIIGNGRELSIVEPFLGTGVVSGTFGADNRCLGNDLNDNIIKFFSYAEDPTFYETAKRLMVRENHEHDRFYEIREAYNAMGDRGTPEAVAHLYYLQNTAHFGLYRIGKEGKYTSTYHFLYRPYQFEERYAGLLRIRDKFLELHNMDYREFLRVIEPQLDRLELFFIDPPYINSSYSDYSVSDEEFTLDDLHFLDEYCKFLLTKHDIPSIICNYSTENDRQIYRHASRFRTFSSVRQMNLNNVKSSNFKQSVYITYGSFNQTETLDHFL